jgi:hypothetical protein
MAKTNKSGRLQLLLIAAVFFGPFFLAWLIYDPEETRLATDSTAHGELIEPVKLVTDEDLAVPREEQDSPYPGLWTIVHVGDGECDLTCEQSLYKTRQVRKALGKEDRRVQRFFLLTDASPLAQNMREEHPGLRIFVAGSDINSEFMAAIAPYDQDDIFLVDPLGNLIMRFTPNIGMKDIHKDLKKLLRVSQIG